MNKQLNKSTEVQPTFLKKKLVSVDSRAPKKAPTTIMMTDGVLIPKKDAHILNSWRITFFGAIALFACLLIFVPDTYLRIFKFVATGIPTTFECTIFAILLAIILGVVCGVCSVSKSRTLNLISGVYVELIRGIPLLVQLIFIYYALGKVFHIEGMVASIISMGFCFGAYMGEIVRAGIQAIPKGQMEAAIALGMSRSQAFISIILPQAFKIILPSIGNEFISMLKDSSLVGTIALSDILRRGKEYISRTFQSLETMLVVALVYLIITLLLSKLVAYMEERLNQNA